MSSKQISDNSDLDEEILACLERHAILTAPEIARKIGSFAKEVGGAEASGKKWKNFVQKVTRHLSELGKIGKVKHQTGYFINRGWHQDQPKAYVFIITNYPQPKKHGEQYQKKLVSQIRDGFDKGIHKGLTLASAEIVMGHDYDTILVIYGNNNNQIGEFVLNYLQSHELVAKTHTVMVWSSEYNSNIDFYNNENINETIEYDGSAELPEE